MKETLQIEEHGALGDGRAVLLCSDRDKRALEALVANGGRVVGWVDGRYRVLMTRGRE
jgi:hypothetical protein